MAVKSVRCAQVVSQLINRLQEEGFAEAQLLQVIQ